MALGDTKTTTSTFIQMLYYLEKLNKNIRVTASYIQCDITKLQIRLFQCSLVSLSEKTASNILLITS